MNVEELADLAQQLWAGIEEYGVEARLRELSDALSRQVSAPAEPTYQVQVSDAYAALHTLLAASPLHEFTPRWREMVDEVNLGFLLPQQLSDELEAIFSRNQITVSVANDEVARELNDLAQATANLRKLNEALTYLEVNPYGLGEYEFEIAVGIPRGEVSNNLRSLGQEFVELEKLIMPFVEVATGSRPPLELRAIASSDFEAVVALLPEVAAYLSTAIDRVLMLYDRILTIRKTRKELKEAGLPDATLAAIDADANELFAQQVPTIVKEILTSAGRDESDGRYFELETELTKSVEHLGYRIDHGFKLTVRTGPANAGGEAEPLDERQLEVRRVVLQNQTRSSTRALDGEPILQLEPPAGSAEPPAA